MRKRAFCIYENKCAYQLRGNQYAWIISFSSHCIVLENEVPDYALGTTS